MVHLFLPQLSHWYQGENHVCSGCQTSPACSGEPLRNKRGTCPYTVICSRGTIYLIPPVIILLKNRIADWLLISRGLLRSNKTWQQVLGPWFTASQDQWKGSYCTRPSFVPFYINNTQKKPKGKSGSCKQHASKCLQIKGRQLFFWTTATNPIMSKPVEIKTNGKPLKTRRRGKSWCETGCGCFGWVWWSWCHLN